MSGSKLSNATSGWPRGLYARAWVHAYASLVGLDPIDTVDEFCRLFRHGDRRAGPMLREITAIVAHPAAYEEEFRVAERRRGVLLGGQSGLRRDPSDATP